MATLRLSLAKDIMDLSDVYQKYSNPLPEPPYTVYCQCSNAITSSLSHIIPAPTTKWTDSVELWKCHEEDYSYLIDTEGLFKIGVNKAVLDFNHL
jgi:hypothetical protein